MSSVIHISGSIIFSLSMEGSEKSDSGKEGPFCEEEEEEIFSFIFGLNKNPRGSMHLIHAVWNESIIAIFICVV